MKFELEPYNRGLPDDALLDDLRRVASELQTSTLTREDYARQGRFHPSTVANRFGGWLNAVDQAGLAKSKNLNVSADECLKDLQEVATRLGKTTVAMTEYDAHGRFSSYSCVRRFGSWKAAIHAAGLSVSPQFYERTSNEGYFQNLENVWRAIGRQPTATDMHAPLSQLSGSAYKRRFGTWRKALHAFIDYVNSSSSLTDEEPEEDNASTIVSEPSNSSLLRKTSRTVSWRLRFLVMRRDNFKCCICGMSPASQSGIVLEIDHIVPWSKGGDTVFDNLQTLCQVCNNGKSNLPLAEHTSG